MAKKKLLIIEDEIAVAKQLKWGLFKEYNITIAGDPGKARTLLSCGSFPVATLDLGLPPHPDIPTEGFKLLGELPTIAPHTKIIVITGNAEEENAIKAISLGAADFCAKPIDLNILKIILERTFRIYELEEANRRLQAESQETYSLQGILGISPAMEELFKVIKQVSTTEDHALIKRKNVTGKEITTNGVQPLIVLQPEKVDSTKFNHIESDGGSGSIKHFSFS